MTIRKLSTLALLATLLLAAAPGSAQSSKTIDASVDKDGKLAWTMTGFKTVEELRAQASFKARITTTHTCGATPSR